MSDKETIEQLEMRMIREYATKQDLTKVEGKLDELGIAVKDQSVQTAILEQQLRHIGTTLDSILDIIKKFAWAIMIPLIGGSVLAAAYFLVVSSGISL